MLRMGPSLSLWKRDQERGDKARCVLGDPVSGSQQFQRPATFFRRLILGDLSRRILCGVPIAGGGRLDPARSGDGDGAERGRDGPGRRVEATSLSQKDGQPPSGSLAGVKRGIDRAGIVQPAYREQSGSRRQVTDRLCSRPSGGSTGTRAERRSRLPSSRARTASAKRTIEPKRKTSSRSPGSSRPLRVLPV